MIRDKCERDFCEEVRKIRTEFWRRRVPTSEVHARRWYNHYKNTPIDVLARDISCTVPERLEMYRNGDGNLALAECSH